MDGLSCLFEEVDVGNVVVPGQHLSHLLRLGIVGEDTGGVFAKWRKVNEPIVVGDFHAMSVCGRHAFHLLDGLLLHESFVPHFFPEQRLPLFHCPGC